MTTFCFAGSSTCDIKVQKFKFHGNAADKTRRFADDMFLFGSNDSKWQFPLRYSGCDAHYVHSTELVLDLFCRICLQQSYSLTCV